jgi:hypothetical protein
MCITKKFPNRTSDVIHLGLSYVQKWKILMTADTEKIKVEGLVSQVLHHMESFEALHGNPSDVGFI